MTEKRRYHRMSIEVPMKFRVPPEEKKFITSTLNVSGMGLFFQTEKPLKERQELLIYLTLPGEKEIEIHGKVVRARKEGGSRKYYIGVEVMDPIKFDEKEFIKFYSGKLVEYFTQKK